MLLIGKSLVLDTTHATSVRSQAHRAPLHLGRGVTTTRLGDSNRRPNLDVKRTLNKRPADLVKDGLCDWQTLLSLPAWAR